MQAAKPFDWFLPSIMWLNNIVRPGKGAAVLVPSSLLRYLTFKLTADLHQIPALQVCNSKVSEPVSALRLVCSLHVLRPRIPYRTALKTCSCRTYEFGDVRCCYHCIA